ncbi:MAG: DUF416 family protein [Myxococcales bacterium]|nr:DUF416 family protein [Myxococcales bacterium]
MPISYDESAIRGRLGRLSGIKRATFALALADRWLPALEVFASSGEARGLRPKVVSQLLCDGWDVALGRRAGPIDVASAEAELARMNEATGRLAEEGRSALFCALYALDAVNDPDQVDHPTYAARHVYQAVDAQLGYILGKGIEETVRSPSERQEATRQLDESIKVHERMQAELGVIEDALVSLEAANDDAASIEQLRATWGGSWSPI